MRESFLPLVRGVYDGCAIVWFFCWISNCHFPPFCWLLNVFLSLPNRQWGKRDRAQVLLCVGKKFSRLARTARYWRIPHIAVKDVMKNFCFFWCSHCVTAVLRSLFMPSSPFAYSNHSIFSISKCINSSLTRHWRVMFSQLLPLLINIYGKSHVLSTTWDTHRKEKQKLLLSEKRD